MSDFGVTPTWVYPIKEEYHTIITNTKYGKKDHYLLSGSSIQQYRLIFNGLTDAQYITILTQWSSVSGIFGTFNLNTMPSYIMANPVVSGHWVESHKQTPKAKSWDVEAIFEVTI